jgi:hypothetical protein
MTQYLKQEDLFLSFAWKSVPVPKPEPFVPSKKREYTREEEQFLCSYFANVNDIWRSWFNEEISMNEREDALKYYRERLVELRR